MAQNVKTVAGIAIANVKNVAGIAIANVKTIVGVDNTSGGGLGSFSDNFTRADADALGTASGGGTWTEANGDTDIFSNTARCSTGSFTSNINVNSTSLGSLSGYIKMTLVAGLDYSYFVFRYTDASSPFYVLQIDSIAACYWLRFATAADGSPATITNGDAGTISAGDAAGITWDGTGTGTVIRIWLRPTANAPTSVSSWDGGSDPADLEFNTDPASAVNVGQLCGFGGGQASADTLRFDNFFAGGI